MNFLRRFFPRKTPEPVEKKITIHNLHEECLALYQTLKESQARNFTLSVYTRLPMPTHRYWALIDLTQPFIDAVANELAIDVRDTYVTPVEVSLDEFFLSQTETYLPLKNEFMLMCNLVIEFCEAMLKVDPKSSQNRYTKQLSLALTKQLYEAGKILTA